MIKCVQKANPFKVLICEIATKYRPVENSLSPSSTTTFPRVNPWLLCIILPQAIVKGSWVHINCFPVLVSYQATAGAIGTQGLIPCCAGISDSEYPPDWIKTTGGQWPQTLENWSNKICFATPWAPFTHTQVWKWGPCIIIMLKRTIKQEYKLRLQIIQIFVWKIS